jgi:hypothetical protein
MEHFALIVPVRTTSMPETMQFRTRGFPLSCLVQDQQSVVEDWIDVSASAIMLWVDPERPGSLASQVLGTPPIGIAEIDGLLIARRAL